MARKNRSTINLSTSELAGIDAAAAAAGITRAAWLRGLGRVAVDSALVLLPPRVAAPVIWAQRAVEHAFERALDLGLGLGRGR